MWLHVLMTTVLLCAEDRPDSGCEVHYKEELGKVTESSQQRNQDTPGMNDALLVNELSCAVC